MQSMEQINIVLDFISHEWPWFFYMTMVILGGVFGSFLTCMLYRVPIRMSLSKPPSHCPNCSEILKAVDLIPVVSYLLFKGRCHYCEICIPPRYMLIELLTMLVFVFTYVVVGAQVALLPALFLAVSLLFIIGLWVESKQLAFKVLLFSIIVTCVFAFTLR